MDPVGELLNKYSPVFFPFFFLSVGLILLTALNARWDKHIRREHHRQAEHPERPSEPVRAQPKPESEKQGPDLNCPYCGTGYGFLDTKCPQCGAARFMGEK